MNGQHVQVRLRADGILTMAVPSQPVRELEPLGDLRFALKGLTGYSVEFVRDPAGNVVALLSHQPNGLFVASRVAAASSAAQAGGQSPGGRGLSPAVLAEPATPPAATAQPLAAAEPSLESLVGDYQSSGLLVQVKLRTDGVLTIAFPKAVPPQPTRELVPLGTLRFAQKGLPGNNVEFMRDPAGNIRGLMLQAPYGNSFRARIGAPENAAAAAATAVSVPATSLPVSSPAARPLPAAGPQQAGSPIARNPQPVVAAQPSQLPAAKAAAHPDTAPAAPAPPVPPVVSSKASSPTEAPSNSLQPARADEKPECVTNTAGHLFQDYVTRKCVDALQSAAAAGDAAAMAQLGWRYIVRHPDDLAKYANPKFAPFSPTNVLVTPDNNVAVEWFRKAADLGNADAMVYLGWMYLEGHGVKQDDAEAARWMRRGAEAGAPRGMAMLGLALLTGRGVVRNEREGESWIRRAAMAGDRRAMASLASILLAKDDRPRTPPNWNQMNATQQAQWLTQAAQVPGDDPVAWLRKGCAGTENWLTGANQRVPPADLSDPFACYELGLLYATGAGGVAKDLLAADMCFVGVSRGFGDRYSVGWYQLGNGRPESILRAAANARKEYRSFEAQLTKLKTPKMKEEDRAQVAGLLLILFLFGTSQGPEPGSPEFTMQMLDLLR